MNKKIQNQETIGKNIKTSTNRLISEIALPANRTTNFYSENTTSDTFVAAPANVLEALKEKRSPFGTQTEEESSFRQCESKGTKIGEIDRFFKEATTINKKIKLQEENSPKIDESGKNTNEIKDVEPEKDIEVKNLRKSLTPREFIQEVNIFFLTVFLIPFAFKLSI